MSAILDIADANIRMVSDSLDIRSPAVVLKKDDSLVFGEDAKKVSKLDPLAVRFDYWSRLSTSPMMSSFGQMRHTADLVYEHLKMLTKDLPRGSEINLIAPATYSNDQLSLLLGISQALGFKVSKILNRSLAAAAKFGSVTFVEFQWRQALVSTIQVDDGFLSLSKHYSAQGTGILDLEDKILEATSKICVDQTRFDPRRSAASEQALLSKIPGLLADLKRESDATVELGDRVFGVTKQELEFLCKDIYAALKVSEGDIVIMEEWASLIPGFYKVEAVTSDSLIESAKQIFANESWSDDDLARLDRIHFEAPDKPIRKIKTTTTATEPANPIEDVGLKATHLLVGSIAYRLTDAEHAISDFHLTYEDGTLRLSKGASRKITVVYSREDTEQLTAGTRLFRSDGVEALLIHV